MSRSLVFSLAVSLVVALGIAAAWSMTFIWLAATISSAFQGTQGYELLYVTLEGQPVIVRRLPGYSRNYADQDVVDLAGRPVEVDTQQLLYPPYLGGQRLDANGREQWQWRLAAANDGRAPATYWYLVHDGRANGRAYGVGYHSRTREVVGFFGTQGFSERMPPREQWFEVPGNSGLGGLTTNIVVGEPYWTEATKLHVVAGGKLWLIDPARRTIKPLVDCPPQTVVGMAYVISGEKADSARPARGNLALARSMPQWLLLREGERVTLVDPDAGASRTYPLPSDLQHGMISGFALPDDQLLLLTIDDRGNYLSGQAFSTSGRPTQEAVWIDRQGQVARREKIRLSLPNMGSDPAAVAWLGVAAGPMPLAGVTMSALIPLELHAAGNADSYFEALGLTLRLIWPCLVGLIAIGCVTATLAYRRQRRFGLPGAAAWAAFAFVLGIPGWIAYRFHRSWPVLEECPACHQAAPRDRDACTECGADFPPPALKGVEVFA